MDPRISPLLLLAIILIVPVAAHPPSDMQVTYDPAGSELVVTINHTVNNPSTHYIDRVEISGTGESSAIHNYTSQPTTEFYSVRYPIPVPEGAVSVTAFCNIGGSITRQLVLPGATTTVPGETPSGLSYGTLWPVHALLMITGFLCFLAGALFPAFLKGRSGWFRYHTRLAAAGAVFTVAALAIAFSMVSLSGGPHIRVPHAYLGLLLLAVLLATASLALLRKRARPYTMQVIAAHRWMGRILLVLMAVTIVSGLFTAGILG
jgi:hypothetical protein